MPSLVVGGQSGGHNIFSGYPTSGRLGLGNPVYSAVYIEVDATGGRVYLSTTSGGITVGSGGVGSASGGLLDGLPLGSGMSRTIPKLVTGVSSGFPQIWAITDAGSSGVSRVYYDIY